MSDMVHVIEGPCILAQEAIAAFKKREQPSALKKGASTARTDLVPSFLNGRKLRDYQRDSLKWMMANFRIQKNCILGDEMVCASL